MEDALSQGFQKRSFLNEYGKEKYGKAKSDYETAYTYLQKEYDETLHEWTKLKKEKQIVLINFNGE